MEIVFSVIIPVYNIESYLKRCVDSFLNQTFTNYEIILIDDGSTDSSGKICDEYSENNEKVHVLHQKNAGVSAARNAGLDVAQGKYIVFADSDDFVEPDLLTKLMKPKADIAIVGFCDYYHGKITKKLLSIDEEFDLASGKGIEKYLDSYGSVFVWGKRYKKSIINRYQLRFREDLIINEDIVFNNAYILASVTAETIGWIGYYHCQYDTPTLSSRYQMPFNERNVWRRISYQQFFNYPEIQKRYVSQTLFFAEKEFEKIAHAKIPFKVKKDAVNAIIMDDFFAESVKNKSDILPKDVRLFCINRWPGMIVLKYFKVKGA